MEYAAGMKRVAQRCLVVVMALGAGASAMLMGGCLKRTLAITTQPEGAIVWLNDVEVGRTPLETDFTFYGTYDVRIRREGYEAVITSRKINGPITEAPGVDVITEALPVQLHNRVVWHWDLTPVAENAIGKPEHERAMIARANELRGTLAPAASEEKKEELKQEEPAAEPAGK